MRSIQSRLSSGLLLSLIIAFSTLWLVVTINTQYLAEEYIASRLKHDAETLLNTISFKAQSHKPENTLFIDINRVGAIYNQPFSGHYYVISSNTQTLSSRSLWDNKLLYNNIDAGQYLRNVQQGPEQQSLLVISAGYQKQNQHLTITVAEDLNPINKNIRQFQYGFAALAFLMLFILVILQAIILRRSLKPLTRVHTELKSLELGQLNKLSTYAPDELRPLISEVNRLLDIMQQRLHRSRNALSDLAHAIKQPLTVIQQLTEKNSMPDENRITVLKQTTEIYQLTDRILKRARLAGHSHSGALFSFSEDLPDLIKTLQSMYANKSVQLDQKIENNLNIFPIDREDMLELLGNLLDNAYKWANRIITISVNINTQLHICIEDDGPGADPEKIDALARRGIRLDEKTEGHGFGLAIANDIVSDYGGTIKFSNSSTMCGLRTDIKLPLQLFHTT